MSENSDFFLFLNVEQQNIDLCYLFSYAGQKKLEKSNLCWFEKVKNILLHVIIFWGEEVFISPPVLAIYSLKGYSDKM